MPRTTASQTVPPKQTSAAPAMVASGIIGGLVALLLAGSMQYAGYIPALSNQPSAATSAELDTLRQEIAALQAAPAPDNALASRVEALEASAGSGGQQLTEQVAALKAELDSLKSATQTQTAGTAQLDQRIAAVETKVDQPDREQAVAQALAAAALKSATERGGSFDAELQTFKSVAPDDPAVEGLGAYAEKGVPTQAELVRRLPATSDAILDAIHRPAADEGIAGRLMSSAMRMVKVRPVGNVEGETPEAVVARMEDRLRSGDLKGAQAEWNALPQAGREASTSFGQDLDARIKVEELMSGTLTRAMASAGSNG